MAAAAAAAAAAAVEAPSWEDIEPPVYPDGVAVLEKTAVARVAAAAPPAARPCTIKAPETCLNGNLVRLAQWWFRPDLNAFAVTGHWDSSACAIFPSGVTFYLRPCDKPGVPAPEDLLPPPAQLEVPPAILASNSKPSAPVYFNFSESAAFVVAFFSAGEAGPPVVAAALHPFERNVEYELLPELPPGLTWSPNSTTFPATVYVLVRDARNRERAAHRLAVRLGSTVQLFPTTSGGGAAAAAASFPPCNRVQACCLRVTPIHKAADTMVKYVDAACTAASSEAEPAAKAAVPPAAPFLTWSGLLYDANMDVPRSNLNWAALGVWFVKPALGLRLDPAKLEQAASALGAVSEPVASYGRLALAVAQARQAGKAVTPAEAEAAMKYNAAIRPTEDQTLHLLNLHYWASEHKDPVTAACTPANARMALEEYFRLGLVATRKRAYRFHDAAAAESAAEEDAAAAAPPPPRRKRLSPPPTTPSH